MTQHDPSSCAVCQRHAIGVGLEPARKGESPRYLCAACMDIVEHIAATRRFDPYELKALDGADDNAGEYCSTLGKTDMAEMDELERRMLWKAAVQGFGERLRKVIREEAPW